MSRSESITGIERYILIKPIALTGPEVRVHNSGHSVNGNNEIQEAHSDRIDVTKNIFKDERVTQLLQTRTGAEVLTLTKAAGITEVVIDKTAGIDRITLRIERIIVAVIPVETATTASKQTETDDKYSPADTKGTKRTQARLNEKTELVSFVKIRDTLNGPAESTRNGRKRTDQETTVHNDKPNGNNRLRSRYIKNGYADTMQT